MNYQEVGGAWERGYCENVEVLGHALRMRAKYITSCTRPPVWRHVRVNRSSQRGLCLLIA